MSYLSLDLLHGFRCLCIRMRKIILAIMFSALACPAWATTYFLATAADGGSDSNNGTSVSSPWLTPNHSVNCGDVILAAASTAYAAANFQNWGTVTCAGGNNVAWLKCVTFDACKISISVPPYHGMTIDASYWGVQGWEVTTTGSDTYGDCFDIYPPNTSTNLHHIIYANNIANVCQADGFGSADNSGTTSSDYIAYVGNIAYSAAHSSANCYAGFSIAAPKASDTVVGTHIYIAGNFSWDNVNPPACLGGDYDGEGIILDTLGKFSYASQVVVTNNIVFLNGGMGVADSGAGNVAAQVRIYNNTAYGNNKDPKTGNYECAEILLDFLSRGVGGNAQVYNNLAQTSASSQCPKYTQHAYLYYVGGGDSSNRVAGNYGYDPNGYNTNIDNNHGFAFGTNTFGINPSFASVADPGAPSCGTASSVIDCMATVISNFTPQTAAAVPYGYHAPSTNQVYDPLFPQWLCNVNLPAGLVTMGCNPQSSLPASPTITVITVQ
jgi:hypothetical protein